MKKMFFLAAIVTVLGLVGVVSADTTATDSTAVATMPTVRATSTAPVYKPREAVVWGDITAISATTLPSDLIIKLTKISPAKMKNFPVVYPAKDGSVIIHVTDKTKFVRQFFGKADLSELAVGDKLVINGRMEADGTVMGKLVRDTSIRKNFLSNKGEVTAIDLIAKTFTFKHSDGKIWTAFVTANTKFAKAGIKSATFTDLVVGDIVAIRGVMRQSAMQITADSVKIAIVKKAPMKVKK